MTRRVDPAPTGAPCWIELFVADTDRAEQFYGELFGWTAESAGEEFGGYITYSKDSAKVAGGMRNDGSAGMTDTWVVYLSTPDIAKVAEVAPVHGGQVVLPPMQVGPLGWMGGIVDPGGAYVGSWQPGEHLGYEVFGEPGTPAWIELHSGDYDRTVAFYREVFSWDVHVASDVPEFRYSTYGEGDGQLAGIMDGSMFGGGAPAGWSVYFGAESTDDTVAAALRLGATEVHPAEDTPYGRLAHLIDPMGVSFKLVQPPA